MAADGKVWRPDNLYDAWSLSNEFSGQSCFVSGATWLRTQWEAGIQTMSPHLISLDNIKEMGADIFDTDKNGRRDIAVGALTTLTEVIKSQVLRRDAAPLVKACRKVAAPSIRNQGTLGGNILTGVGDTIPALLVLDAKLHWFDGEDFVTEPLEEWLKKKRSPDRILVRISFPVKIEAKEQQASAFSFYTKIGRREAFTPSVVTVAGKGQMRSSSGEVSQILLAAGGGSMTPMRLRDTEAAIKESSSDINLKEIYGHIRNEFRPIDDAFVSAEYKNKVAANVILSELYRLGRADNAS